MPLAHVTPKCHPLSSLLSAVSVHSVFPHDKKPSLSVIYINRMPSATRGHEKAFLALLDSVDANPHSLTPTSTKSLDATSPRRYIDAYKPYNCSPVWRQLDRQGTTGRSMPLLSLKGSRPSSLCSEYSSSCQHSCSAEALINLSIDLSSLRHGAI